MARLSKEELHRRHSEVVKRFLENGIGSTTQIWRDVFKDEGIGDAAGRKILVAMEGLGILRSSKWRNVVGGMTRDYYLTQEAKDDIAAGIYCTED